MMTLPPITVFDTETTGLDPRSGHRIIEIAGIRVENGCIDESKSFISLVNPERAIPWEAKRIHKIEDSDVAAAPTIDQVLPSFLSFAAQSILVAHNATFDVSFLEHEKEFCWGYIDLPECLCTMLLSRSLFPKEFSHSLDNVSRRLGLSIPTARHRALPDVILTTNALLAMIKEGNIQSIDELRAKSSVARLAKR